MYKHFIWDFDGTLYDTFPLIITLHKQVLLEYGIKEDMNKIYKMIKEVGSEKVLEYYEQKYNIAPLKFIEKYYEKEKKIEYKKLAKPAENVEEVCKYIKNKGYNNFIISNRSESIINLLEHFSLLYLFEDIIYVHNNLKRKPNTDMFEYLLNKHNLLKTECLYIGDRNLDLIPAKKIGLDVCLYRPVTNEFDYKPNYIINDMKELYKIIDNN